MLRNGCEDIEQSQESNHGLSAGEAQVHDSFGFSE